ncbi:MAG: hypothetical protein ACRERD_12805 [Candidatus Binatia bacterium]
MKKLYVLLLLSVLGGACSRWLFPQKVQCCEEKAACCHEQMCCLPRYAKAAGREPKAFTPEAPVVYGLAQDLEPKPGETITKPGLLSRLFSFGGDEDKKSQEQSETEGTEQSAATEEPEEEQGFFRSLLPF